MKYKIRSLVQILIFTNRRMKMRRRLKGSITFTPLSNAYRCNLCGARIGRLACKNHRVTCPKLPARPRSTQTVAPRMERSQINRAGSVQCPYDGCYRWDSLNVIEGIMSCRHCDKQFKAYH